MNSNGLGEGSAYTYWTNRYADQKEKLVDFVKHTPEQAESLFQERIKFFFEDENVCCPRNLCTLDFGCGVGRYSTFFENYLGVDLNDKIVEYAQEQFPSKKFCVYEKENRSSIPTFHFPPEVKKFNPQLFFTSTVLQHCNDSFVLRIFDSLQSVISGNKLIFFLYENEQAQQSHVCGRSPDRYTQMVEYFFIVKSVESKSHIVHGEKHTITKIVCYY